MQSTNTVREGKTAVCVLGKMFRRATNAIKRLTTYQGNLNYFSVKKCIPVLNLTITPKERLSASVRFCSSTKPTHHVVDSVLDHTTYERVCTETMDALNDYFEELLESVDNIPDSDIAYSDGVLTIKLGLENGTYVINRQSPNRQLWLSSPSSGPKRYDFSGPPSAETGKWIYRHTGESLHELLQHELQKIFKEQKVDFEDLPYGR